ncbi:mucin desulfatase [Rhodothermaceae bacterium RA]|nr:mucin desulfatase [Rhodothermaceae bacterium RA]
MTATEDVQAITRQFQIPGDYLDARPLGTGHINDTYVVRVDQAGVIVRYLVQRLNTAIFRDPQGLMDNMVRVTAHLRARLEAAGTAGVSRRVLTLLPSRTGTPYHRTADGHLWRALLFIEGAETYEVVDAPWQAEEAGRAFGRFQAMLCDLPGPRLSETIPQFHDVRRRFDAFEQAVKADVCGRAAGVRAEVSFARARAGLADAIDTLQTREGLPERITHNDTKINNLLFDRATGHGLCVVDLDTVMPGFVLYDFGDLMRTAASTAAEDERDLARVGLNPSHFEALVRGYLAATQPFLTPVERRHLVLGGKLMTFVMGLRFLTDHLEGDVYYKVDRPGHNLDRCRAQFRLLEAMEVEEDALVRIVERVQRALSTG